ncbi:MAG: TonB-dependent receptor [Halieaceae bacterium]|nr:TonB-dependent receptor [Halieaceae bacterium]
MNSLKPKGSYAYSALAVAILAASSEFALAQIDEIIVTAQKREEGIQNVPMSVTAISGDMLEDRGFQDPRDLVNIAPNMVAYTTRGETSIAIRGVGLNVLGASPAVAIHIDGVYQPRASMADLAQTDVERVEVLRGPQGTLYGRNANGGVVNYITRSGGDEFGGYLRGSYGDFDEYRVTGAVDVPIADRLRARVVGSIWERGEGFVENVIPGQQDLDKGSSEFARVNLEADITDNFTGQIIASYAKSDGPINFFQSELPVITPFSQPLLSDPALNIPQEPHKTAANDPHSWDREYTSFSATFDWDLNDAVSIKSISAYQRFEDFYQNDGDATNFSIAPLERQINDSKTFTQEVNLSFDIGRINGVVGGFYMTDDLEGDLLFRFTNGIFPFGPGGGVANSWPEYKTDVLAFFGDVTLDITDRLTLFAGARWSEDKQDVTQFNQDLTFLLPPGNGGDVTTCDETNEFDSSEVTPRAGFQFDVTENSNIYASYSKGFKIGGLNYRTGCNDSYDSETLNSYEIGSKNSLLDGRLILNATAFYYDYENLQVEQLLGFAFFFANAPEAEVMGVELESVFQPVDQLTINANMSYQNSEFKEFSNLDAINQAAGLQDLSGNPIPNAPDVTANIGASYVTDPVILGGSLTFRGDVNYWSRRQFREFDVKAGSQEGYALLSGSVTWNSPEENFAIRVYGNNLTDEEYKTWLATSSLVNSRIFAYGAPRQFGIEFSVDF